MKPRRKRDSESAQLGIDAQSEFRCLSDPPALSVVLHYFDSIELRYRAGVHYWPLHNGLDIICGLCYWTHAPGSGSMSIPLYKEVSISVSGFAESSLGWKAISSQTAPMSV